MMSILKLVFSNPLYGVLSLVIFALMLISLLLVSEFLFLEPYVAGHILPGEEFAFLLIVILSILSSLVIPMNIYRISMLKKSKIKISGSMFGSFIGSIAGACSCGPIGFALFSTFGSVGATTLAFLTNFEIPIRLGAIGLLIFTYFATIKSLKIECTVS